MTNFIRSLFAIGRFASLSAVAITATVQAEDRSDEAGKVEFFEKKIRPLLVSHCYQCHSAETKPSGGLRVDDRNGLLVGGNSGPAIVAGKPEDSLILERVHRDAKKIMPKEGDLLTEAEIADLTAWIKDGVAWPCERIPAYIGRKREDFEDLKKRHWAWQPLKEVQAPEVGDKSWPRSEVDRFLLAGLEAKKLAPVADADPITLLGA